MSITALSGWFLASINFYFAVFFSLKGLRNSFNRSMWIIFGTTGIRMVVMLAAIPLVMLLNKDLIIPFSVSLLGSFVLYIIIEIAIIFKYGLKIKI